MRRRDVLLGTLAAGALAVGRRADAASGPRNVVVVFADGGWDLTFTFDPKPNHPDVVGPYIDVDPADPDDREAPGRWGDVDVLCNPARRPAVTTFFERWGHRTSVVRGVWVGSVSHWIGQRRILSGTDDPRAPDLAVRVGDARAHQRPLGAVDLSHVGRFGAGPPTALRGGRNGQLGELLRPHRDGDGLAPDRATRRTIDRWLAREADHDLARRGLDAGRAAALRDRDEARERAEALRRTADRLVLPPVGRQTAPMMAQLASSLLATRTCGGVIVDSGSRWDTHVDHVQQHGCFQRLFLGLDVLLRSLDDEGILEDTLVVVMSEMMRTPWRNRDRGTDHWPYSGLLLAGGGIEGGQVYGGTDDRLVGLPYEGALLQYDEVIAGILDHLGVERPPDIQPRRALRLR